MVSSVRSLVLILATLLGWCAWAAPAVGEEDPNKIYNDGLDLAQDGRFEEAVGLWTGILGSVAPEHRPHVHKALGLAYRKLARPAEAWHHAARYLELSEGRDSQAASWLAELESALSKENRKVVVSCTPGSAEVHLGESAVGPAYACPLTWWFEPGRHSVFVVAAGHRPQSLTIEVMALGDSGLRTVALQPLIDPVVVPREHPSKVAVTEPGEGTIGAVDEVGGGGPVGIQQPPDMTAEPFFWKWGLAGAGGILLATGGILQVVAFNRNESLHDKYPADPSLPGYEENKQEYDQGYEAEVLPVAIAAYTLYGVGTAAAVTGVVFLLLDPGRPAGEASSAVSFTPLSLPGGGGAEVSIRF